MTGRHEDTLFKVSSEGKDVRIDHFHKKRGWMFSLIMTETEALHYALSIQETVEEGAKPPPTEPVTAPEAEAPAPQETPLCATCDDTGFIDSGVMSDVLRAKDGTILKLADRVPVQMPCPRCNAPDE